MKPLAPARERLGSVIELSSLSISTVNIISALAFTDSEHLGAT